jgi:uncharacterized protein involved in exopolysaccharide biosynthesis
MKNQPDTGQALDLEDSDQDGASLADLSGVLVAQWKTLLIGSMAAALIGLGCSWIMPKTYLARTVIMPPQQQQQNMAGALSSLGALAGLAGAAGLKNTTDQYIALMQSSTVSDRLIDRFGLMKAYQEEFRVDARKELLKNVFIGAGKKDGLITIEVEDRDPDKAAKMANAYVDELRLMTNTLAVSEAQQRRKFFELKMNETKSALTQAQIALQSSGVSPGLLKAEPKAAAEGYARIRAEVTASQAADPAADAHRAITRSAAAAGTTGCIENRVGPTRAQGQSAGRCRVYWTIPRLQVSGNAVRDFCETI